MKKLLFFLFTGIFLTFLLMSCAREEEQKAPFVYEGPLYEADSIRTLYSDSGLVRVMVQAPKQYEYESGDREFPQGIYIEFYEPDGKISSTLTANKGFFFRDEERYTGIGDVEVESRKDQSRLLTDTLHYGTKEPYERQIYTKDRVTIIEGLDTLRGKGLEASRDFYPYTILSIEGSRTLDEASEEEENEEN